VVCEEGSLEILLETDIEMDSKLHLEAVLEMLGDAFWDRNQVQLRDAPGGRDRADLEMHLEVEIQKLRHAIRCHDRAGCGMHWGAEIQ